jgi:hypothetical protein
LEVLDDAERTKANQVNKKIREDLLINFTEPGHPGMKLKG